MQSPIPQLMPFSYDDALAATGAIVRVNPHRVERLRLENWYNF
ncbi:MAG: hypothetical protein RIE73_20435 [Coleofasciculus sp. C1-SOL-03]